MQAPLPDGCIMQSRQDIYCSPITDQKGQVKIATFGD